MYCKKLTNTLNQRLEAKGNVYKKFLFLVPVVSLPLIVAFGLNLYLYDPVQLFHKPYGRANTFFTDMRVQAKGIIDHYDFDSYILGTSILENTIAQEAQEKLGGKWVNISLSGSSLKERSIVLEYLLKKQSPKQIIYSIDVSSLLGAAILPFLYNDTSLDDIRFYLNNRFILCSLSWSKQGHCVGSSDLDNMLRWILDEHRKNRFGGIKNWIPYYPNDERIKRDIDLIRSFDDTTSHKLPYISQDLNQQMHTYIKDYIITFVRSNPQTHFHFIMPTYHRFYYKAKVEDFLRIEAMISWLVLETKDLENVSIYGFDTLDYADEIANYEDLYHYNIDMNSMQLDAIAHQTHILNAHNVGDYFHTMRDKIETYDAKLLVEKIKALLKANQENHANE